MAQFRFQKAVYGSLGCGLCCGSALHGFFEQRKECHDENGPIAVKVLALFWVVELEELNGYKGTMPLMAASRNRTRRDALKFDDRFGVIIDVADWIEQISIL